MPTERLVEVMMSQAEQDVEVRTQLLLEAASAGRAELKRLADERWDSLSDAERASAERSHFHLVEIREHLAKVADDVDARVELPALDLSYPYDYVEITDVLIEANRGDDALAWAEHERRAVALLEERGAANAVARANHRRRSTGTELVVSRRRRPTATSAPCWHGKAVSTTRGVSPTSTARRCPSGWSWPWRARPTGTEQMFQEEAPELIDDLIDSLVEFADQGHP
jgi:hypothetical protein